jgi:hypothetical protein
MSVRLRLGSTTASDIPHAGCRVVVVACPSALVTVVAVTGLPSVGV